MDNVLYKSLSRYFNILSKLGYMNYTDVNKLLALIFIYDLLESDCNTFITEDEYRVIGGALYCLYGSNCLIPYPEYIATTSISCSGKSA